jgi:hypothetical protein
LAPTTGPDALYSGLLECPLTTRITKHATGLGYPMALAMDSVLGFFSVLVCDEEAEFRHSSGHKHQPCTQRIDDLDSGTFANITKHSTHPKTAIQKSFDCLNMFELQIINDYQ